MDIGAAQHDPTQLIDTIGRAWTTADWRRVHVVVAVSGGPDSVALLRGLATIKDRTPGEGKLVVAHFNHRLRGEQSDTDAAWVAELCRQIGVPCEVGIAEQKPDNLSEEAARNARYAYLLQVAERLGARFLATAHTADDQLETVLMRLLRGTGIAGLGGMRQSRALSEAVTLVRPLLSVRRADLLTELKRLGQPYLEDATNLDQRYTRNRVRHSLLPMLREEFGEEVDASLLRAAQHAAEAQGVIEGAAQRLIEIGIRWHPAKLTIEIERGSVREAEPLVVAEAVKLVWRQAGWPEQEMGRQHWRLIDQLVRSDDAPAAFDLPGGVHAHRTSELVRLTRC